jgi:hypothetical protein
VKARCEVNVWLGAAGTVHDVDPDDPEMRTWLRGGLLTEVQEPHARKAFCLQCDPPTFHDDDVALGVHVKAEHEGGGG